MVLTSNSSRHWRWASNASFASSRLFFFIRRKRAGRPSGSVSLPSSGLVAEKVRLSGSSCSEVVISAVLASVSAVLSISVAMLAVLTSSELPPRV